MNRESGEQYTVPQNEASCPSLTPNSSQLEKKKYVSVIYITNVGCYVLFHGPYESKGTFTRQKTQPNDRCWQVKLSLHKLEASL